MPGLVKIGYTGDSVEQRLSELYTTGLATPFQLEFCVRVATPDKCEAVIHAKLQEHRLDKNREFFRISVLDAVRVVLDTAAQMGLAGNGHDTNLPLRHADVTDAEETILSILSTADTGACEGFIVEGSDSPPMKTRYMLLELEKRGYVRRVKGNSKLWELADNGVRYFVEKKPDWFTDE